jgi:hypothetical protein
MEKCEEMGGTSQNVIYRVSRDIPKYNTKPARGQANIASHSTS